ncbi:hypothetical protein N0V90_012824 [Kalmusia sp. IMI 367209]|nr:hypothetical protein N0V90_012824 [Kalmusia sp. IMI 367209]
MDSPTTDSTTMDSTSIDSTTLDSSTMEAPIILIVDWEEDPPLTTKYINGDNELDLGIVYANINRLRHHPGRGRIETGTEGAAAAFRMKECSQEFLDAFWECAGNLCDYFADFLAGDSVPMQSLWFHMLDVLQQAAILPHFHWLPDVPFCKHAQEFMKQFEQLREVILATAVPVRTRIYGHLVRPDYVSMARLSVDVGGFKDGLKMWQQFLYKGSPGFTVPIDERVYTDATGQALDFTSFEQHVPRGGLALIRTYTEKLREFTEAEYAGESDDSTQADELAEFDLRGTEVWEQGDEDGEFHMLSRACLLLPQPQNYNLQPEVDPKAYWDVFDEWSGTDDWVKVSQGATG